MKNIFMSLLNELKFHGEILEANMYRGGKFSSFIIETKDGIYTINIGKEEKTDAN